ncbi:MAG: diadenylate cyclase [Puniceicoccales bacterium]|jgi:DNA integrity scanning protein DisA with diadenylate cyclase activity/mannitol/fructose-specific phosphotransferase system IIA component (Ntr-type)|nr:diadenylate cyclase [Puniceicoccales bacterium]
MHLSAYFARKRLVNLHSQTLEGTLSELIRRFSPAVKIDREAVLQELIIRENRASTCLGNGIAIPHLKIPLPRPCILAIGRCPNGIKFGENPEYEDVRLVFLILFNEGWDGQLQVLAQLARELHDPHKILSLIHPQSLSAFYKKWQQIFGEKKRTNQGVHVSAKGQRIFLKESFRLARSSGCQSIFLFPDSLGEWFVFGKYFLGMRRILVTERFQEDLPSQYGMDHLLNVSNHSRARLVQMHGAILIALTRGFIGRDEKICCIGSGSESGHFDCLVFVDVAIRYKSLLDTRRGLIPKDVSTEVFERVIAIAHQIAAEGREGKPLGAMFILGNHAKIKRYYKSLILNPFQGYPRQERNVLNPFIDETIKEFASIDGAFIVGSDGVFEAAGTMINAPSRGIVLPGGLGTRHTSAAAISKAADSLAIVVSQSTSQVTLFRNGRMLPLSEKVIG